MSFTTYAHNDIEIKQQRKILKIKNQTIKMEEKNYGAKHLK